MNRFEVIAKLIVPAFFLIVWALNQIFNKETPATPNRGGRPVGPPGGRPQAPPRRSEEDRAFATADPRSGAWSNSADPFPAPPRREMAGPDEIVILGSETVRRPPPAQPRTNGASGGRARQPRRGNRPPEAPRPEARPAQPQRLGGNISQSVNQSSITQQPLDMRAITQSRPLSMTTDLAADHASSTMLSATASVAGSAGPSAEVFDLRAVISSPARIREAFVLNELLQPPKAIRNRRGRG